MAVTDCLSFVIILLMIPLTPFANPSATSMLEVNLMKAFSATVKDPDNPPVFFPSKLI